MKQNQHSSGTLLNDSPRPSIAGNNRMRNSNEAVDDQIDLGAGEVDDNDSEVGTAKVSHDDIARRAYEIYLETGSVQGRCDSNWQQAEAELRQSPA